jgi:hypothetical protein
MPFHRLLRTWVRLMQASAGTTVPSDPVDAQLLGCRESSNEKRVKYFGSAVADRALYPQP